MPYPPIQPLLRELDAAMPATGEAEMLRAAEQWHEHHRLDDPTSRAFEMATLRPLISAIADEIPHLDDPLGKGRTELASYIDADETYSLAAFGEQAVTLANTYVEPIVANRLAAAPAKQLLLADIHYGGDPLELIRSLLDMEEGELMNFASERMGIVQERIQRAFFGGSRFLLNELLARRSIEGADEFQERKTEIEQDVISDRFRHATVSNANHQSLGNIQRRQRDLTLLNDYQNRSAPKNDRERLYGCPAGRLTIWAPKFLFAAYDVVSAEAVRQAPINPMRQSDADVASTQQVHREDPLP